MTRTIFMLYPTDNEKYIVQKQEVDPVDNLLRIVSTVSVDSVGELIEEIQKEYHPYKGGRVCSRTLPLLPEASIP